jgi:Na+-driven multidrug efflux pump
MIYIAPILFSVVALFFYSLVYFLFKTFLSRLVDDPPFVKEASETMSLMFLFFFFFICLVIQYQQVILGIPFQKAF